MRTTGSPGSAGASQARPGRALRWLAAAGGLAAAIALAAAGGDPRSAAPPAPDPLAALGITVSGGAAPGYVPDRACSTCHRDVWQTYQSVGMARSFYPPRLEDRIEDFDHARFTHAPSHRTYEMVWRGGELYFRRFSPDPDGKPANLFEQKVDWVLGSGHHARVYLYRTPAGELYQLPVAWYTQEKRWGMAPGFDRPDHSGVARRVRRECMFCHNAYPEVPAGSDAYGAAQTFPAELPEGTGCQRCHGPGAEHVRLALRMDMDFDRLRAAIVNPARLPAERRDDVCYECHLQPAVALPAVLRFGRGDDSFRPGESLADYRVEVDAQAAGAGGSGAPGGRFEINHQAYRLRQSRCFIESRGALSCLTCHDPHRRVPEAERAAHYRAACLGCHQASDCKLKTMGAAAAAPAIDPADCVACHMPKRRPQDVVHVVMTDHLIRRVPGGPELVAPLAESEPELAGVALYDPARAPAGELGELYRADALVRAVASKAGVDRLAGLLAAAPRPQPEPALDLAQGQLRLRRYADAMKTLDGLLASPARPGAPSPSSPAGRLARELSVIALAGLGRADAAIAASRELLAADPGRAEAQLNLGRLLAGRGRENEAVAALSRATEVRPVFVPAWFQLGRALHALGREGDAAAAYRRALAVDPSTTEAYLALAEALLAAGRREEALGWLDLGAEVAARPQAVAAAREKARAAAPGG